MANLLTTENKKKLIARQNQRKIFALFGLSTAWLLVGLIFNSSLWFNLEAQRKILIKNLDSPAPDRPPEVDQMATQTFRQRFEQLRGWGLDQAWSESLAYLQSVRPETIKVSQIVGLKTDNGQTVRLALAGHAANRQALVGFVDHLKQDKFFRQVDLPVSYLLESADNQFIINLELTL